MAWRRDIGESGNGEHSGGDSALLTVPEAIAVGALRARFRTPEHVRARASATRETVLHARATAIVHRPFCLLRLASPFLTRSD